MSLLRASLLAACGLAAYYPEPAYAQVGYISPGDDDDEEPIPGDKGKDWNRKSAGPSKYFVELEYDSLKKHVVEETRDTLVVLYGHKCSHCQEIKPQQDKGAEKIKKETDEIHFGRLDLHRYGGPASMIKWMGRNYPNFHEDDNNFGFTNDELTVPSAYLFRGNGSEVIRVPHGDIGWGPSGGKLLKTWVKKNTYKTRKFGKKRSASAKMRRKKAAEDAEDAELAADEDL
jgi:hypothetical protein